MPDAWLLEPWRMPPDVQARCGVRVGQDIATPLVDLASATKAAKARMHALRNQEPLRVAKAAIVEKAWLAAQRQSAQPKQPRGAGAFAAMSGSVSLVFFNCNSRRQPWQP